jgi:hypothetical protein
MEQRGLNNVLCSVLNVLDPLSAETRRMGTGKSKQKDAKETKKMGPFEFLAHLKRKLDSSQCAESRLVLGGADLRKLGWQLTLHFWRCGRGG